MRCGWHVRSGIAVIVVAWALAVGLHAAPGATYFVSLEGDDANPGGEEQPFQTVRRAIEAAQETGGSVTIGAGVYDLEELTTTLEQPLTIEGAGADATTLSSPGTITFTNSLTVRNLKFTNGQGIVLKPYSPEGGTLDGVLIEDCAFEDCRSAISTSKQPKGVITNFMVRNCRFNRVVSGIMVTHGLISRVRIIGNTFTDIGWEQGGASAIIVGSNATQETTEDVVIYGNLVDGIIGSTEVIDEAGHEVHGVLAYGTDLAVIGNTVRDMNAGRDHEAIYTKARHSVIADNVVENCGSGGGGADIANKGGEFSVGNVICGNRVTGDLPGRGIFISGGCVVVDNYVKKTSGSNGIDVYPLGKAITIADNYAETCSGTGIYVNGGDHTGRAFDWPNEGEVLVLDNVAISYERQPIKVTNASRATIMGNETRQGRE